MKHIRTFESFLSEAHGPGEYEIRAALKKLRPSLKDDDVVFTVDDEKLDTLLHDKHRRELDTQEVNGDSYYIINKRDFDRFIDSADSSGFDVDYEGGEDSVIYVYESTVNESYDKFIVGKTYTHPQLGKFKVLELSSDSKTKVEFLEGDGKGAILYIAGYGSEGY